MTLVLSLTMHICMGSIFYMCGTIHCIVHMYVCILCCTYTHIIAPSNPCLYTPIVYVHMPCYLFTSIYTLHFILIYPYYTPLLYTHPIPTHLYTGPKEERNRLEYEEVAAGEYDVLVTTFETCGSEAGM